MNFRRVPVIAAGVLGSLVLSGCAVTSSSPNAVAAASDKAREECIFSVTVRDWSAIDRERLIIYGISRKEPYLVKLAFPSVDLPFATAIGVRDGDNNGRICAYGFDQILVPGSIPDRISILSVQRISVDEAKRLTDEARPKKKPKAEKADKAGATAAPGTPAK